MRLFYRPGTGRPLRVAWALEEVGADYELVPVSAEETALPEHRARHPLGRVPALEDDDGNLLFESTALVFHIGDQHPGSGLMPPPGSPDRARVYQWAIATMTELEGPIVQFMVNTRAGNAELAAAGAEKFGQAAAMFEAHVDGRRFLVGDSLTAADIVTGGVLLIARLGRQLEELPSLSAYLDRLRERPGFQKSLVVTESFLRDAGAL
jgi:glutathione S-transferase